MDQQAKEDFLDWLYWIGPWVAVVLLVGAITLLLMAAP